MYQSLQGSRAIAAILVVLYHLGGALSADKYFGLPLLYKPFSFGSAGVEFFFVLSGFIIFTAHRKDLFQPKKLGSYLKKRFARIYPAYWIIFMGVFLMTMASSTLRSALPEDPIVILKSLLLYPQDKNVVGGSGAPIIIVAWTLQYEMFFYLTFALLIVSRSLAILAGLSLLYIYCNYNSTSPFPLSFIAQSYVLLFVMGIVTAWACTSHKLKVEKPASYSLLGALVFAVVALDTVFGTDLYKDWRTVLYGMAASFIFFGFVRSEDQGQTFLQHRWIQLLGNASYALYLIHYPLISILCKVAISIGLNKIGILGALITHLVIFSSCLMAAVIFHLRIEKPVTAYFRSPRDNKP